MNYGLLNAAAGPVNPGMGTTDPRKKLGGWMGIPEDSAKFKEWDRANPSPTGLTNANAKPIPYGVWNRTPERQKELEAFGRRQGVKPEDMEAFVNSPEWDQQYHLMGNDLGRLAPTPGPVPVSHTPSQPGMPSVPQASAQPQQTPETGAVPGTQPGSQIPGTNLDVEGLAAQMRKRRGLQQAIANAVSAQSGGQQRFMV